jgi:hypothetical protein
LPSGGEVIYLFYGENEFEKRQAIAKLIGSEKVARHDGEDLTLACFSFTSIDLYR